MARCNAARYWALLLRAVALIGVLAGCGEGGYPELHREDAGQPEMHPPPPLCPVETSTGGSGGDAAPGGGSAVEGGGSAVAGGSPGSVAAGSSGGSAVEGGGSAGADGDGAVRDLLPAYYDFVLYLKANGFTFMDFATYWKADKKSLPEKLFVMRHDVHARDVDLAYSMRKVEQSLLPEASATYFVMLGFPSELHDTVKQQRYRDVISWLHAQGVDVQPHISPNDMYVSSYHPAWAKDSLAQLQSAAAGSYSIVQHADGIDIDALPNDLLDIRSMDGRLLDLLRQYNENWTTLTGLTVSYYAAHGSHIPVNLVMNNATLLDQRQLLATGIYEFDAYNTQIHAYIGDLGDNDQPPYMDHPETIEPGRYEFLAHPYLWQPSITAQRLAMHALGGGVGCAPIAR